MRTFTAVALALTATGVANAFQHYDREEHMLRQFLEDQLEAREFEARSNGKWTKAIQNVNTAVNAIDTAVNTGITAYSVYSSAKNNKREELELLAREIEARSNGKWTKALDNITTAVNAIDTAVNTGATAYQAYKSATSHRREIDDHMAARAYAAELEARANGKWTKAIDNVSNAMYALNTAVNAGATAYNAYQSAKAQRRELESLDDLL